MEQSGTQLNFNVPHSALSYDHSFHAHSLLLIPLLGNAPLKLSFQEKIVFASHFKVLDFFSGVH